MADRPHMSDLSGVRYLGSGNRGLSVADLSRVGVDAKEDLHWGPDNSFTVPISQLNAATVDFLSTLSDEFELV